MKKIFTLVAAMALVASAAQAQRITGVTVKDNGNVVKTLNDFAALNPNSNTGLGGVIEYVFLPGQQLENLTLELTYSADTQLKDGETLPTNFSSPTAPITIVDKNNKEAQYVFKFKNIKPYTGEYPFRVSFSSTNGTAWDNTVEGWAGACIDENTNMVKFSGPSARSFILGVSEIPGTLSFKGYFEPKNGTTGWQDGETITVQTNDATLSGDWKTIMTFDKNNPLVQGKEAFTEAEPYKVESLDNTTRYIRFVANRKGSSLNLNSFLVTKGKETAISDNMAAQTSAFVNGKELSIINAAEVAKVEVINVAGQSVLAQAQPTNSISLNALSDGVYLVRLTMVDGSAVTTKVAIK